MSPLSFTRCPGRTWRTYLFSFADGFTLSKPSLCPQLPDANLLILVKVERSFLRWCIAFITTRFATCMQIKAMKIIPRRWQTDSISSDMISQNHTNDLMYKAVFMQTVLCTWIWQHNLPDRDNHSTASHSVFAVISFKWDFWKLSFSCNCLEQVLCESNGLSIWFQWSV